MDNPFEVRWAPPLFLNDRVIIQHADANGRFGDISIRTFIRKTSIEEKRRYAPHSKVAYLKNGQPFWSAVGTTAFP